MAKKLVRTQGSEIVITTNDVRIQSITVSIDTALKIKNELNALFSGDNPALLKAEIEHWKRRAGQHGCNVEEGDHECG